MSNLAFELPDDPVPVMPTISVTDLTRYEEEAQGLIIHDDVTEQAALFFCSKTKEAEKSLDAERKAKTDPLNAEIERITAPYRKAITVFKQLRELMQGKLDAYRVRVANERAEAQRKAIADANRQKAEQERKAEEARRAAETARANGNQLEALRFDTKADRAELVAAMVVPEVIPQQAKTVVFDDAKVTVRTIKDFAYENGLPRGQEYFRDDARFKTLPDEFWVLDEKKIGRMVRAGAKIPGIVTTEKASVTTRK